MNTNLKNIGLQPTAYDIVENDIIEIEEKTGIKMTKSDYVSLMVKKLHTLWTQLQIAYINSQTLHLTDEEISELLEQAGLK